MLQKIKKHFSGPKKPRNVKKRLKDDRLEKEAHKFSEKYGELIKKLANE